MLTPLWVWVENIPVAVLIRRSNWLFPTLETVHVLAIVLVVGTITIVDLRLLGFASRERRATEVMREMLPLTWGCFVVALCSGALMFSSSASSYAANLPFQLKFLLLLGAGINMGLFQRYVARTLPDWDAAARPPRRARLAAALSLLCWTGVVVAGRWIGFSV